MKAEEILKRYWIFSIDNPETQKKCIIEAMEEYADAVIAERMLKRSFPQFGDYCTIEQKRYGCKNEHYTHKVIGTLQSNTWVEVPVQSPATEVIHYTGLVDVVACVCEGISEREILRYRISDIRNCMKGGEK